MNEPFDAEQLMSEAILEQLLAGENTERIFLLLVSDLLRAEIAHDKAAYIAAVQVNNGFLDRVPPNRIRELLLCALDAYTQLARQAMENNIGGSSFRDPS